MQVTNRRRRMGGNRKSDNAYNTEMSANESRGSHFPILRESHEVEDVTVQVANDTKLQLPIGSYDRPTTIAQKGKETIVAPSIGEGSSKSTHGNVDTACKNREMAMELDDDINGLVDDEVGGLEMGLAKEVASNERIIVSETTLNKENHTTS
ncbi:hypothetical protein V6N13_033893 [Hibiscus sabdariffa]